MSYGLTYTPYNTNLFLDARGINPNAVAFIAAAGITGAIEVNAVNDLVNGLQADGLWSKMKAVYPFVTDNRNLASYTEDFGNAYWTKANTTATLNATTAPNGSSTADLIIPSVLSAPHVIYTQPFIGASQIVTNTIYAKAAGYNFIGLSDAATGQAVINLSNGTIVSQDAGITASTPVNVGNGWWRCVITFTATTNRGLGVDIWSDGSKTTFAGNGTSGVYLWGAQSELGSTATTYQPIATTQQAYIAAQFKYNLVNPVDSDAAFRLVFNGGWTHSSTGALPNGTNGYADTKFNNQNNWTATSNGSLGISIATNPTAGVQCDIGSGSVADGNNSSILYARFSGNVYYGGLNCSSVILGNTNASSIGFFVASRLNTTQHSIYKRGSSTINSTATNAIGTNPNKTIYIGAGNDNILGTPLNYSDRKYNYSFIGDGLTQSEVDLYYSRITTFNTALSR